MAKTSAKKSENKAKKGTQTNMWTGRFASGMRNSFNFTFHINVEHHVADNHYLFAVKRIE